MNFKIPELHRAPWASAWGRSRAWMISYVRRLAEAAYIWSVTRQIYPGGPHSRTEVVELLTREVAEIPQNVREAMNYQDREQAVLKARLSRRFDLGLALNEAANRAIAEKQDLQKPQLSAKQQAALKFQEEYLQRVVDRS